MYIIFTRLEFDIEVLKKSIHMWIHWVDLVMYEIFPEILVLKCPCVVNQNIKDGHDL